MLQVIRSDERYHFETDWLSTYWHFSFDHYHDPANLHFGPLRVFNDDVVRPGGGFPMHAHREMEILTYVLEGQLEHRDSMGNTGVIGPGEVQRMSAGTGVRHSEYNASKTEPVHLLQFWILPAVKGLEPSWEQLRFTPEERRERLLPVAIPAESPDGERAVRLHQDATVYASELAPGQSISHTLASGRRAYLFIIAGELDVNGTPLRAGDQGRITKESALSISASQPAHFLLIDLP